LDRQMIMTLPALRREESLQEVGVEEETSKQSRQAECNNLEKRPAAHATQAVLPPREERGTAPCGQEAQAVAAATGMKEPGEHGRHCPVPAIEALGLKVPATQGTHAVEPSGAISCPRGPTYPSRQMHAFALQVPTVAGWVV